MAKSSNQAAEPRAVPTAPDTTNTDVPEATGIQRIPFVWRLVFMAFIVCFGIMVLYEVSVLIGKIFQ